MPIPRLILKMAPPAIVAQLVNLLYNIVDRIYIGHIEQIGKTALTGVGLCTPVLMLVTAFAMLASAGGSSRSAIAMGQGNREEADRILGNCFSLLLIFAAALTSALLIFSEPLLVLFGASDQTLPFALEYMRIYCCGSIFVMLTMGLNYFISAQGFSGFAMLATILGGWCGCCHSHQSGRQRCVCAVVFVQSQKKRPAVAYFYHAPAGPGDRAGAGTGGIRLCDGGHREHPLHQLQF